MSVIAVLLLTGLVLIGLRRTTAANTVLVTITITALVVFAVAGLAGQGGGTAGFTSAGVSGAQAVLAATAFLFVAYTGYGRIATLGEEVHDPEHTIPKAVIITLVISIALYLGVAIGGRALGGPNWGSTLDIFTEGLFDQPWLSENDRVFLFFMDYETKTRIKLWARARVDHLKDRAERRMVFEVEAWDVNCPQHIPDRYRAETVALAQEKLLSRIAELEAELAQIKAKAT